MASHAQIEETFNYMDELMRETFGDHFDLTCAFFDGDYEKTLEQAQSDKHRLILDGLKVGPGTRLLDVGCGWGPLLMAARERGAEGVGITLSSRQLDACRSDGLDVQLMDWRDVTPETFGPFDAVAAVGSMEHFCSPQEYEAGEQDAVYEGFFRLCDGVLPSGGRVYVQSMVWGPGFPRYEDVSVDAPKDSNEYKTAMLGEFYPGAFGAFGVEHYVRCAGEGFKEVYGSDGTRDYVETMNRWAAWHEWTPRKLWLASKLLWPYLTDASFRRKVTALRSGNNKQCFERKILTLARLILEKS